MTAYSYPGLDSVLWRSSTRAPALEEIIAFGAEDGYLAAVDAQQAPVRVDLRLGVVTSSRDSGFLRPCRRPTARRSTRSRPPARSRDSRPAVATGNSGRRLPASALFAQSDGSLIVAGARGETVVVWRMRPPGHEIVDTLTFDVGGTAAANAATIAATAGSVGDRVFFGAQRVGHRRAVARHAARPSRSTSAIRRGDRATPSGDRLFVALDDDRSLRIVDRFEERVSGKIRLPGVPTRAAHGPAGPAAAGARRGRLGVRREPRQRRGASASVRSAWRRGSAARAGRRGDRAGARRRCRARQPCSLADGRVIARRRAGVLVHAAMERLSSARRGPRSAGAVPHLGAARHVRTTCPTAGQCAQRM